MRIRGTPFSRLRFTRENVKVLAVTTDLLKGANYENTKNTDSLIPYLVLGLRLGLRLGHRFDRNRPLAR
jgi:hypothetical protein